MLEAKPVSKKSIKQNLAVVPAIGSVLLPALTCPGCWPAYAGLLSSLGLGFVDSTPYLLPVTIVFLALALFALGYRATNRRGYKPLFLGFAGAVVLVIGKFVSFSDVATYSGIALLVGASLWNSWSFSSKESEACPACI